MAKKNPTEATRASAPKSTTPRLHDNGIDVHPDVKRPHGDGASIPTRAQVIAEIGEDALLENERVARETRARNGS